MAEYSCLAYPHGAGDFGKLHSIREAHLHHPASLWGKIGIDQGMNTCYCLLVGPIFIVVFLVFDKVSVFDSLMNSAVPDMG